MPLVCTVGCSLTGSRVVPAEDEALEQVAPEGFGCLLQKQRIVKSRPCSSLLCLFVIVFIN